MWLVFDALLLAVVVGARVLMRPDDPREVQLTEWEARRERQAERAARKARKAEARASSEKALRDARSAAEARAAEERRRSRALPRATLLRRGDG